MGQQASHQQPSLSANDETTTQIIGSCIEKQMEENKYSYKHYVEQVRRDNNYSNTIPSHWIVKNDGKLTEFQYPYEGFKSASTTDVIKFQREMAKNKPQIPSDTELPQIKPNTDLLFNPDIRSVKGDNNVTPQVTWIGHSTFLIQYRGVNILTDPVFSERCSPSQYFGPSRIKPLPIDIENLPTIHYIIISHNHYDHLDYNALIKIQQHHDPIILLPLRMKYSWMEKFYQEKNHKELSSLKLVELDWWKSVSFNTSMKHKTDSQLKFDSNITFTFLPAQHWSLRSGFDKNEALWGSWGVEFQFIKDHDNIETVQNVDTIEQEKIRKFKLWFAGDTGYSSECFTEIGNRYGPIDMSFIPIGAYEPRWMMKPQHINPEEAVQIALDVKSKKQIGMHWGTFILTTEPIMQPKIDLESNLEKRGLDKSFFETMNHGSTNIWESTE
ncbi:N-acyl-phosphatidylethanolamine-hydrolyzing phospholipase D-like protein [Naegleria gruberi]|uniref:N-acyl-phosphatidylethanolamine-hydrolyzing phospholipase D-like protein n=1 Tax=Naegleria gruberi TaxID=5762 RepID=D2UZV2_NAEGR|nr:N-acyl-phosphatidylethanolamine-hydrolyzing phospholipase D-like protein [Naegleria gruberi]EFC50227.1 N-acyl-phosphatidylethanolamine-hydrolyzing phospholipase D-like protein [Naegleria gruberi]|eukprot:XP_002682971.1 N-acyl-phosphatidylethanolamine-hydrolyzing phospholipase D-like protein [Naegleria gruberi strain NEG-M]